MVLDFMCRFEVQEKMVKPPVPQNHVNFVEGWWLTVATYYIVYTSRLAYHSLILMIFLLVFRGIKKRGPFSLAVLHTL